MKRERDSDLRSRDKRRRTDRRTEGWKGKMKKRGDAARENEGAGEERSEQQVSPVARRKSIPNYAPVPLGAKRDKKRLDYIFV